MVGTVGLGGCCASSACRIHTLSNISLAIRSNRFVTIINASKYKGAALVGVLKNLSASSFKNI